MIGIAATIRAMAAGTVNSSENSVARDRLARAPVSSLAARRRDKFGQQDDAHGDTDHAKRKLVEPVGIGQPGQRAVVVARHLPPDEQVDLHHATGQRSGQRDHREMFQLGCQARQPGLERVARAARRPPDQRQLRDAANRHRERQRGANGQAKGFVHAKTQNGRAVTPDELRDQNARDEHEVQQDRRSSGGGEVAQARSSTPDTSAVSEMKRI